MNEIWIHATLDAPISFKKKVKKKTLNLVQKKGNENIE
jgi:hypothetical protein